MIALSLLKPLPGRSCVGLSCCAPAIVDVVEVLRPGQWKVESFCRGHFLDWAADVETFEFPPLQIAAIVNTPAEGQPAG